MADIWLGWVLKVPVAGKGNGPFGSGLPLGWVLHVNESNGNLDGFFAADPPRNPASVCPNFQVYKDGTVHQHLPLLDSPWCQADGNFAYAAIETEGFATEPLTSAQVVSLGRLHSEYRRFAQVPDQQANAPGQRGIGVHYMGGASWGGHSCPGPIRAGQRANIISASQSLYPIPVKPSPRAAAHKGDLDMYVIVNKDDKNHIAAKVVGNIPILIHDGDNVNAYRDAGIPVASVSADEFNSTLFALGGARN